MGAVNLYQSGILRPPKLLNDVYHLTADSGLPIRDSWDSFRRRHDAPHLVKTWCSASDQPTSKAPFQLRPRITLNHDSKQRSKRKVCNNDTLQKLASSGVATKVRERLIIIRKPYSTKSTPCQPPLPPAPFFLSRSKPVDPFDGLTIAIS